ncbi:Protein kinase superfamily protein [Striga hermonthica]|uniref:Protein kinase superfamily protein n=1 Tax=Striga hermonthica TaxID=68872 RepID=A0A9N7R5T0_STRHE|nr:Protein kinase superfamily protein [Striga hermonthica]
MDVPLLKIRELLGILSDRDSVESAAKTSSSGGRAHDRKEFLHRFIDCENLRRTLTSWLEDLAEHRAAAPAFDPPFERIDLQKFDYALEGVQFQQLVRMPSAVYEPTSGALEGNAFLALEDFMHTSASSLWEAFWGEESNDLMPFYVSSLYDRNLKFYQAEKVIARGKTGRLCASAIMLKNPRHPQGKWDDVVELALLRPGVRSLDPTDEGDGDDSYPSFSLIGEALFFALRVLIARSVSRSSIPASSNYVFVLVVDSQHGSVVRVEGDLNKMDFDLNSNIYESAASWFKNHSRVSISPVERIWNNLGNANWGDVGALQALYATYHSIAQFASMPKNAIEDLAADHICRLQARKIERQLADNNSIDNLNNTKLNNNNGLFMSQHRTASPEIVELNEESVKVDHSQKPAKLLEVGDVVLLEDSNSRNGYRVDEVMNDSEFVYYITSRVDKPGEEDLFLYAGPHPSQMELAWEDMKLWYQVQRQTKVLGVMRQRGVSSKYLPRIIASGRAIHLGPCRKSSSGRNINCDNPWCGTPILVTAPVGPTVADLVKGGEFGPNEAIKCCHDCLSALSASGSAGVRHGDVRPENSSV